ncbi:hypothetical protein [Eisenibacter elegans]|jgi:hypothetical protein|uniref:hypothetical protein n=1 Tax=Eisenibacter elegans TaxID=997 RepID=UPI0003F6B127|nr:hypothetical protein [Eisenibacter elegans]
MKQYFYLPIIALILLSTACGGGEVATNDNNAPNTEETQMDSLMEISVDEELNLPIEQERSISDTTDRAPVIPAPDELEIPTKEGAAS